MKDAREKRVFYSENFVELGGVETIIVKQSKIRLYST
jgi:hypothetical protein